MSKAITLPSIVSEFRLVTKGLGVENEVKVSLLAAAIHLDALDRIEWEVFDLAHEVCTFAMYGESDDELRGIDPQQFGTIVDSLYQLIALDASEIREQREGLQDRMEKIQAVMEAHDEFLNAIDELEQEDVPENEWSGIQEEMSSKESELQEELDDMLDPDDKVTMFDIRKVMRHDAQGQMPSVADGFREIERAIVRQIDRRDMSASDIARALNPNDLAPQVDEDEDEADA